MMRQRGDLSRYVDAALTSMDWRRSRWSPCAGEEPPALTAVISGRANARVRRQAEGSHCDDTPGQRTSEMAGT